MPGSSRTAATSFACAALLVAWMPAHARAAPTEDEAGIVQRAIDYAKRWWLEPVDTDEPAANEAPVEPVAPAEAPPVAVPSEPPAATPAPAAAVDPPADEGEVEGVGARRIDVRGEAPRHEAVSASDFDIEPGKLSLVPRGSAEKLMTLAPGVFMVNEGGEGHPSSFFLRGFDAGVGQDIEFKVAGVPINEVSNAHSHGFADTLFVIPEAVRRLRVTEGPFDARQGDFAVAGTADFDIGMERRGVVASGSYGRFDTGRALLMWGPEGFGPGTFVAVDVKAGDGFGTNRAHRAVRAMGGFAVDLPRGFVLSLLGTGYGTRFDSAGVIRQDDFEARSVPGCGTGKDAQFFCTYDRNQGGALSRVLGVVKVGRYRARDSFEQLVWVTRKSMRMREDFTGFLTDVPPAGEPQRGDGLEQRYEAVTAGMRGSYGLRRDWRWRPQELELGYGVRFDDASSISRRLRRDGGQPYATMFDAGVRVVDVSLYAASTIRPLERLDINLGLRMDAFWFGTVDRNRPTMDRDGARLGSEAAEAFGVSVGPRISTGVTLVSWPRQGRASRPTAGWGALQWLSAYGVGSRSSDATALSDGEFAPFARVQSVETGLRLHAHGLGGRVGLDARSVLFYTHVDRDLVFDETAARNLPVGESNRFGALAVVRTNVDDWLDVQASFTWTEAYLPPRNAGPFDWNAGARLPYVPRFVLRGDTTLWHDFWIRGQPFDWSVSLGLSHIAPRPLPLDVFGTRYTVVDLGARMRWRYIELGMDIQNLFDARYHQLELFYASNFQSGATRPSMLPQLHFVAGQPLMAMGTLTLYFEPNERKRLRERRAARGITTSGRSR